MAGLHHEQRETQASIRAFASARTIAMTGLMVGMPRCTGIRTEALTLPYNSCGVLDFTHAFRTSATHGRRHYSRQRSDVIINIASPIARPNAPINTKHENHSHTIRSLKGCLTQAQPRTDARMILISFSSESPDLDWLDERIWPQD